MRVVKIALAYSSLSHTKWNCKYHIMFTRKFHRKIICGKLKRDIANILSVLCKRKGVKIVEAEMCSDYVHMPKRGVDTRVSMKQAFGALGFKVGSRGETELNQ